MYNNLDRAHCPLYVMKKSFYSTVLFGALAAFIGASQAEAHVDVHVSVGTPVVVAPAPAPVVVAPAPAPVVVAPAPAPVVVAPVPPPVVVTPPPPPPVRVVKPCPPHHPHAHGPKPHGPKPHGPKPPKPHGKPHGHRR